MIKLCFTRLFVPLVAAASPAGALQTSLSPAVDSTPGIRQEQVYTVDASGLGDFSDLATAIAAVPSRSLLLLRPGVYSALELDHKSLRIESVVPHAAQIAGRATVQNMGPNQAVYLSNLLFLDSMEIRDCQGPVSLFGCRDDSVRLSDMPPGWRGCIDIAACNPVPLPGDWCNLPRHLVETSDAVALVDCQLTGGDGYTTDFDGAPGEHALQVIDSKVTVYGGSFIGGDGGDCVLDFHAYPGSGGDGIRASGLSTHLRVTGANLQGGAEGLDPHPQPMSACPGRQVGVEPGATYTPLNSPTPIALLLPPLVHPGAEVSYVIYGSPGATVLLKAGSRRGWREFPGQAGVFHLGAPFRTIPLGTIGATGVLTGTVPPVRPQWPAGLASLELQAHAILPGADRFSEPRTLHITATR